MLTFLPCISALLCLIKMKFGMWLRYTLGRFVFRFHKIWMGDDVIMTSYKFWRGGVCVLWMLLVFFIFLHLHEIVEALYFHFSLSVCLCVCLCVCVSGTSCEQNSSRTDAPIWMQFSLNGCFPHWLKPYWIWWPWVKGQGHSDVIPIFSS